MASTVHRLSKDLSFIKGLTVGDGIVCSSIIKRFIVYQGIDCWGWHRLFTKRQTASEKIDTNKGNLNATVKPNYNASIFKNNYSKIVNALCIKTLSSNTKLDIFLHDGIIDGCYLPFVLQARS